MTAWFAANWSTLVIGAALLAVVAAVVIHLVRARRQGKSSCSCGCSGCPMSDRCHEHRPKS